MKEKSITEDWIGVITAVLAFFLALVYFGTAAAAVSLLSVCGAYFLAVGHIKRCYKPEVS